MTALGFATAAALILSGCAANESGSSSASTQSDQSSASSPGTETPAGVSGTFNAAGASSQEAAQASWVAEFQNQNPDVTINYNPVGSGSGRKQFIEGAVVYAGSDSALSEEELAGGFASCAPDTKAVDLPVYISPIAVIFNIDGVDALNMDAATLAKIFRGDITSWDDPAIVELNPDAQLPSANITVVYRSDDSGTTKNFADYLQKNVPDVWGAEPEDKFPFSFAGAEGAQGTSGVVSAVSAGKNTIGYADASKAGELSHAAIKVGDDFVAFSPEAAAAVVDASPAAEGRDANDLAIKLDRTTTAEGTYPLVLVSYLIVCQEYADSETGAFVRSFVSYVASDEGQQAAAAGAGSAPISQTTRDAVLAVADTIK